MLRQLVLKGPSSLGFFEGAPLADICASLTNVPSSHWEQNPLACEAAISNKVEAYRTVLITVLALVLGYRIVVSGSDLLFLFLRTRFSRCALFGNAEHRGDIVFDTDGKFSRVLFQSGDSKVLGFSERARSG